MKSLFHGSAIAVAVLFSGLLLFSARPSVAETPLSPLPPQDQNPQISQRHLGAGGVRDVSAKSSASPKFSGKVVEQPENGPLVPAVAASHYVATAYSLRGRTASGKNVDRGMIAADPRVLPLGSRVRLEAGAWSGEYLVADTGGAIRGRKIDIWTPTSREAMRFGRRTVKLTVLSYGGRRAAKKRA
ncbi:MAG: 3D domain-containing protein [Acidobacteriota bacterium]